MHTSRDVLRLPGAAHPAYGRRRDQRATVSLLPAEPLSCPRYRQPARSARGTTVIMSSR